MLSGIAPAGAVVAQSAASAPEVPAWAFPNTSPPFVAARLPYDSVTLLHVPNSTQTFTLARVKNTFAPPDWYPTSHPVMPPIVATGRPRAVWACGYCHLPDGQGRAENATIAGLPVEYFVRQVADFRTRARHSAVDTWGPSSRMNDVADSVTDAEVMEAARYFARIRVKARYKVVERAKIPVTMQVGGLYAVSPAGGTEQLGDRIIEITEDVERHELRDAAAKFLAYVPPGSIARGKVLSSSRATSKAMACATCHGPSLRGAGLVPPIAGRSPSYMFRQLVGFKTGARSSATSGPMQAVVSGLGTNDMIAAVAYAASLTP
ncbi:MAG: cytochrome c class [Gemmatimonadetes bacterium]|nr:cytochrome c class [Gemmatimonadota bacterium]